MDIHPVRFDNPEKGAKLRLAPFLFHETFAVFSAVFGQLSALVGDCTYRSNDAAHQESHE
ncbi:hypothetical protein GCM10023306_30430 [Novosphingobium ginsenosidimutans]